jgi:predicted nucleic acid-binding protein
MKLRLYLDTSVLSAYFDERAPERMAETRGFWAGMMEFDVAASKIVREEIERTPDIGRRTAMLSLLAQTREIGVTREARELARRYTERGLFSPIMFSDAMHLAVAVLDRQDILVSWNFKHLVNRRMRAQACEVNAILGLPMIEILAPSEL